MGERLIRISRGRKLSQGAVGLACAPLRALRERERSTLPVDAPVLIVEPFGMGDVIALEPLVSSLLAAGRQVVVCARAAWRAALPASEALEWVEAELPWSRYAGRDKYRPSSYREPGFRATLERLRAVAPGSIGVDVRGDVRSVLLLWAAGCPRVLSLSRYVGSDMAVPREAAELVHASSREPRWRQNLAFLEPLGSPSSESEGQRPPRLPWAVPRNRAPASREVCLVPLAPWPGRHWPARNWDALRAALTERGIDTAVACGPGQSVEARALFGGAVEPVEHGSLEAWAAQLAGAACIVSVNTGPMHLAATLGVPLVTLNGPSALPLWAPSGEHVRVLHHQAELPCAPCHEVHDGSRCGFRCMELIGVDEVLEQVLVALGSPPRDVDG